MTLTAPEKVTVEDPKSVDERIKPAVDEFEDIGRRMEEIRRQEGRA